MLNEKTFTNRWLFLLILAGLLLGAVLTVALAFNASPVSAQTPVGDTDDGVDSSDSTEGPDIPITGDALEKASAAALDYIGEGRVTETEVGDEEGYYEVEITRPNGREVDVHLDEAFNVLVHEND